MVLCCYVQLTISSTGAASSFLVAFKLFCYFFLFSSSLFSFTPSQRIVVYSSLSCCVHCFFLAVNMLLLKRLTDWIQRNCVQIESDENCETNISDVLIRGCVRVFFCMCLCASWALMIEIGTGKKLFRWFRLAKHWMIRSMNLKFQGKISFSFRKIIFVLRKFFDFHENDKVFNQIQN